MNAIFKLLQPADFTPEVMKQVIDLGIRSGTWKTTSDPEYYNEQFLNPENINVVCISQSGSISGYILAPPHNEAVSDYLELDPLMTKSNVPMFYVDHVNVDETVSGRSLGIRLIIEMIKEANFRGASRFSMHCRVVNGLSRIIKKKFQIYTDTIRRIDKYSDCNEEPFDYMEGEARF